MRVMSDAQMDGMGLNALPHANCVDAMATADQLMSDASRKRDAQPSGPPLLAARGQPICTPRRSEHGSRRDD